MLIYSQDRKTVCNVENMTTIGIDGFWILVHFDNDFVNLGMYKTEERAKEVLGMIVYEFKQGYLQNVFCMPEE